MLSRVLSRRFAGSVFQKQPGLLMTPPRFVDSMGTKATTWWTILGIVGFYTTLIVYNETSILNDYIKAVDYAEAKYARLEDFDTVLRTKLVAARLAAEDEDDE